MNMLLPLFEASVKRAERRPRNLSGRAFAGTIGSLLLAITGLQAQAQVPVTLGQASSFGVLAGSTVTNTGSSVVSGNVGVSPGSAITGFPPGIINGGALHNNDALAQQAQVDLTTAYNVLAGETLTIDLTGQDLGSLTLTPGVYHFVSSAQLTGLLTLDALGNPNARFDFQIGSTLTTAPASTVTLINGGNADNVFWQVGSSATLDTTTAFQGNILALTSITLNTGASDCGRILARNGAVTLDTNTLGACGGGVNGIKDSADTPEPGSLALLGGLGMASAFTLHRRRSRSR